MDQSTGTITKVVPIDQSPQAQWALLRRCPFKYEHLLGIIETLESSKAEQKQQAEVDREKEQAEEFKE